MLPSTSAAPEAARTRYIPGIPYDFEVDNEESIMSRTAREPQLETMLTTRQVADFLQVSICSVRRWSDRGILKFYRVGSRGDRRYWREDVLRFLETSSRHPRADSSHQKVRVGSGTN